MTQTTTAHTCTPTAACENTPCPVDDALGAGTTQQRGEDWDGDISEWDNTPGFEPIEKSPALVAIDAILEHGDDDVTLALLDLLIVCGAENSDHPVAPTLRALLGVLSDEETAALRLAYDICPMHHVDADICADDDVVECREARQVITL